MSDVPIQYKNLKPWTKGSSGNPAGNVIRLPPELRAARKENMAQLIKLIHLYVSLTDEQAKERLSGPGALQLEEMIQGQISKAKEGDSRAFQFIIEVMCGKIPESDENSNPADKLSLTEKIAAAKMMVSVLEREEANGSGTPESTD